MNLLRILPILLFASSGLHAQTATLTPGTTVFKRGTEGYVAFRIPAIVLTARGDLLAFAEARKTGMSDTGNIDVVLRRSIDNGVTWSALQIVGEIGDSTYGNPVPIVAKDGTIHLVTTSNHAEDSKAPIVAGTSHDIRRVHYQKSTDDGETWTTPREITKEATNPGEDWRWYATGPVHGIQLERGDHAGRLIVPCDHSDHSFDPTKTDQRDQNAAHILYSDDQGKTWQVGGEMHTISDSIRPWESTAVELTDGRVYLNARNEGKTVQPRAQAYSSDGGETLGETTLAPELIEPEPNSVQGALLRVSAKDKGDATNRILFSNPAATDSRRLLTVRSSFDETETWNEGRVIHKGPSAYSDMVLLPNGEIGILYEGGAKFKFEKIIFKRFSTSWLDADGE